MGTRSGNPLWKNGATGGTPITADKLNNIEDFLDSVDTSSEVDVKLEALNTSHMSTYVTFERSDNGEPITGGHITVKVDPATHEITDIIWEA